MAILLGREEVTLEDGTVVSGQPIEVDSGTITGNTASPNFTGTANFDNAAFEGNVTIDGDFTVDTSGSGENLTITGGPVVYDGSIVGDLELAPAGSGDQIILRSVNGGAAALFVNEGLNTYADATDSTHLASNIHIPNLPVYADHSTAQGSANLATGQTYAITGGAIGVKLA